MVVPYNPPFLSPLSKQTWDIYADITLNQYSLYKKDDYLTQTHTRLTHLAMPTVTGYVNAKLMKSFSNKF